MKQILKWSGLVLLAAVIGLALAFGFTAAARWRNPASAGYPGYGPGMMGGWRPRSSAEAGGSALTLEQAVERARGYLSGYGNSDLALTEVMGFSDNFYAEVEEESSGIHAFELLIDRYSGAVYPEPGPNMMWNTKYGHMGGMGGMMGAWRQRGWRGRQSGPASVTAEQARDLAQSWLDRYLPGKSAAAEADEFYGYYTIHVLDGDQIYGMLSVNGYSGDVWYHDWHGSFIDMKELED